MDNVLMASVTTSLKVPVGLKTVYTQLQCSLNTSSLMSHVH